MGNSCELQLTKDVKKALEFEYQAQSLYLLSKKNVKCCLKSDQEWIIWFKNSRLRLEFLNLIIHRLRVFLNGFKISAIDQLILVQIFRFGVILD